MIADMLKKLFELIVGPQPMSLHSRPTERQLIHEESKYGRNIFGPVPAGRRRDFFCLDAKTWIWNEEWTDPFTGQKQSSMIRYEIHSHGVLKIRDNQEPVYIEGQELTNLANATRLYFEQVVYNVYHYDPNTGHPLPKHLTPERSPY